MMKKETADKILAGVAATYDGIAESFSATRGGLWPEMRRFRDFVKSGDRVLDIGCGNGRAYHLFEGLAIDYQGVDVSAGLIAEARRLVQDPLAEFRVGSMLALPYDDASCDAVLAVASLHHIPSDEYRRHALREMWRVLKPGGTLFMTNWNRWKTHWRDLALMSLLSAASLSELDHGDVYIPWKSPGPDIQEKKHPLRYYHSFRPEELASLCLAAGFEVLEQYFVMRGDDPSHLPATRANLSKGDNLVTICRRT